MLLAHEIEFSLIKATARITSSFLIALSKVKLQNGSSQEDKAGYKPWCFATWNAWKNTPISQLQGHLPSHAYL